MPDNLSLMCNLSGKNKTDQLWRFLLTTTTTNMTGKFHSRLDKEPLILLLTFEKQILAEVPSFTGEKYRLETIVTISSSEPLQGVALR